MIRSRGAGDADLMRHGIRGGDGRDEQERRDEPSSEATARSMPSASDRCTAHDLWHVATKVAMAVPRGRARNIDDETT